MTGALDRFLHGGGQTLPLVFGAEQLGGHNWGAVDVGEVQSTVAEALDLGVRIFDTADVYGLGASEERLGRALRGRWDEVFLAAKFGVRHDGTRRVCDSSPAWCAEALRQSLARLGTDHVDLYQLHCWDGVTPLAEIFGALDRLVQQGRIRAFGFCNLSPAALPDGLLGSCATFSKEYSLLLRENEEEAATAIEAGLHFLPYGVLGQGMLSGRYTTSTAFGAGDRRADPRYRNFHGVGLEHSMKVVAVLRACAEELGLPPARLAIAWVRGRFEKVLPLVGLKTRAQLRDAVEAVQVEVPQEVRSRLDAVSSCPE